jgi:hypothetical protein
MKSTEFLQAAIDVQAERGKQYDKPTGERSMAATVSAFNCITGSMLEESDGWMFLGLLKLVRQSQNPEQYHHDSALDFVAYASLYAESASEQCGQLEATQEEPSHIISDIPIDLSEWQEWKKGDIVESMEGGDGITNGDSYILTADPEQESGDIRFYDDEGCARIRDADKYRFVFRPARTAK